MAHALKRHPLRNDVLLIAPYFHGDAPAKELKDAECDVEHQSTQQPAQKMVEYSPFLESLRNFKGEN